MQDPVDPVDLTARLIRCPSVTPFEGGALDLLAQVLSGAGFECTRVDRDRTPNLFARWGEKAHPRTFGFNGHTDVVPAGDTSAWTADPFGGEIRAGQLWGRGATDMKSGVAAFAAAACDLVRATPPADGAIILAITGDEEGDATDGTVALLDWMRGQGEQMGVCLVGEPTSQERLGDMMKIGRRGSMTAKFTATGVQGHSAYPHRARNPVHAMARLMDRLACHELDKGTGHFDASTLAVTTIDTGNPASNVIPARCTATVNIRFNDAHSSETLTFWLETEAKHVAEATGCAISMDVRVSGESFLTPPGLLSALVSNAVRAETGADPALSTSGGTSDARFVKDHCPVVEFGLPGKTMHQVDERVAVEDIRLLKTVYGRILRDYFA
jgi:succinyl-diaminopimelate desuccinylase